MASAPKEYTTAREDLAVIVAQITSGIEGAIPEQDDFDLATEVLADIEKRLSDSSQLFLLRTKTREAWVDLVMSEPNARR